MNLLRWVLGLARRVRQPAALGLLSACLIAGCATTPRNEAIRSMTGFERETLDKLDKLRKGMTPQEVLAVMGPADDGSLFEDAARYWVLSLRPIVVVLPAPARFDMLARCVRENTERIGPKLRIIVLDDNQKVPAGTYRCMVDSTAELQRWRDALVAELPAGAGLATPLDVKERDAVAKIVFEKGRLSSAYLIHPAPSPRGSFYFAVIE